MKTNTEFLKAWDGGEEITTVEMGGMGDDYEMCIHLIGMEWLRQMEDKRPDFASMSDTERKEWRDSNEPLVWARVESLGLLDAYGPSGAQVAAATNLASVYYRNGYEKGLEMAGSDRHIRLKKKLFEPEPRT